MSYVFTGCHEHRQSICGVSVPWRGVTDGLMEMSEVCHYSTRGADTMITCDEEMSLVKTHERLGVRQRDWIP
jgi:hypothetical protein